LNRLRPSRERPPRQPDPAWQDRLCARADRWYCLERKSGRGTGVSKNLFVVLYFVVMVALIVGADLLLLRNHFWARLVVNIGIVVVFAVVYLRFFKNR
jgi:hypothetical protein